MGKDSLLEKFTDALFEDEDGENISKGIDREIEGAIKAIKNKQVETLDGNDVLLTGWGEAGDMVYVMDLNPIYALIGGHKGRLATFLGENCEHVFGQHVPEGRGHAFLEDDFFFMRFANASETEGFRKAATIVNDIGTHVLGDAFKTIKVPTLVVATTSKTITDEHGHLDLVRVRSVVHSGGIPIALDEPKSDDPEWMKLYWDSHLAHFDPSDTEWQALKVRKPGDDDWVARQPERRQVDMPPPHDCERRRYHPRRATDHVTEQTW